MRNFMRRYIKDDDLVLSRRAQIAEYATRLFVDKGYDRVSMREIAEACDMGIGSLYRYVGSKEDILYLAIDGGVSRYVNFCEETFAGFEALSPTEALKLAIEKNCQMVDSLQDLILFAYQEVRNLLPDAQRRIFALDRRLVDAFERILVRGCEVGEFRIANVTAVAHDIVVIGEMWAVRRWFLQRRWELEGFIKDRTNFILDAICVDRSSSSGN